MNYDNFMVGIVVIILFLFFWRYFKPTALTLEGMKNNSSGSKASDNAASIKTKTIEMKDELLLSKYKTDYEDVIINMSDNMDIVILKKILSLDSSDEEKLVQSIKGIETLYKFKAILNSSMKVLDSE